MQRLDTNGILMPKPTRLALAFSVIALTQVLVGCGNAKDKVANKESTSETTGLTDKLDCSSPSVISTIQQTTLNQITQQATTNVQQLAQQAGIANTNIDITSLANQMNIAVTNPSAIAGQADQCQANIAVTLPETIISKANQIALSLNQPTVAQNLATKGLNLEKTTITAINAGFKLTPTQGTYKATPSNGTSPASVLMSEVGNLVANAQLAQLIGTGGATPSLQPANPTTGISNEPTQGSNAISNDTTPSQTVTANTPVIASPPATVTQNSNQTNTPVVIKKTTTTTHTEQVHTPKKVEKAPAHSTEQKVVKTVTKTTQAHPPEKTVKAEKPHTAVKKTPVESHNDRKLGPAANTTEMGPAAKPTPALKPATKPTTKPVTDDEVKLTIEEKNEKY